VTDRDEDAQGPPIPFDEVARLPLPGAIEPVGFGFGPDNRVLTYRYAPDGGLERRLFALDLDDLSAGPAEVSVGGTTVSEKSLSLEEQLRRERSREVGVGITAATWAERADALLVPLPDGLHVLSGLSPNPEAPEEVVVLGGDSAEVVAPCLSPDGGQIAFVRRGDLHVVETRAGASPRTLTDTAEDGLRNGVAEFVAEEEMGRSTGLWWSPDSSLVAYCEVDERHIPIYRIVHQGSDEVGSGAQEDHRYPFAGKANATVRLGVVPASGGETVWMHTGEEDGYLARVHWLRDGRLVAEVESRDQRRLELVSFDPATGEPTLLHSESGEPYLNLHDDFRELTSGEFIWSSERSGFRHLEVRSASGELVRVLTSGKWQVDALEGVDEQAGAVYFTGTKDGPTERHLYVVALAGGEVRRLTDEPGTHSVTLSTDGRLFVDRHGALGVPPTVRLRALAESDGRKAGQLLATLHDRRDPRIDALGLEPPELHSIPAHDGTELFGLYYRPQAAAAAAAGDPPPLAVQVYGGPHAQLVVNDWGPTVYMRAQALSRLGVAVLVVDNRGSARRGLRFEAEIHRHLGELEVEDQVAGVLWAAASGLADPARVGVYGWSYGGYMTLRCLGRAPETFRVGVSGAPVTDWDGYDTHYTERYMGTPASNSDGYRSSSAFGCVEAITGDLLLVHGLIDENVHFRHTARLVNRLIAARKPYGLLFFPAERHLPRRPEDRAFLEEQVINFLAARLAGVSRRGPALFERDLGREGPLEA
jgi:dipeptidyl-peptidase-4